MSALIRSAPFFEQLSRLHRIGFQRTSKTSSDGDLSAVLLDRASEYVNALMRTIDSTTPDRREEWYQEEGSVFGPPRAVFEERLEFLLATTDPLRPPGAWLSDQVTALAGRWEQGEGDKPSAVALMDDIRTAGIPAEVVAAADRALDCWLARELFVTDQDWVPYLEWLEHHKHVDPSTVPDLPAKFEAFAREELSRWSPEPPSLPELRDCARRLNLWDLEGELDVVPTDVADRLIHP